MHRTIAASLLLLALLTMAAGAVKAEVYKWVDAAGNVHFTDKAVKGSKQQHTGALNAISNPGFNKQKNSMEMRYVEQSGNMLVQGQVNGIAMQFIVDTGATYVAIPPGIAKRARIQTSGAQSITLQTANGQIKAPLIRLANIEADGVKQRDIQATVQELSPDGNTGLLGMSFLSAFHMSIDQGRKMILLEKR